MKIARMTTEDTRPYGSSTELVETHCKYLAEVDAGDQSWGNCIWQPQYNRYHRSRGLVGENLGHFVMALATCQKGTLYIIS